MNQPAAERGVAVSWEIAPEPGKAGHHVRLVPDADLRVGGGMAAGEWRSKGEHACFTMRAEDLRDALPGGWYRVEGRLLSREETATISCLYPGYATGADGDAQISLPDPGDGGRVRAIVLFKYDVESLRFCPVQGAARFELHGFSLRRVTRLAALWQMLGPTMRVPGGRLARAAAFAVRAARRGLSGATDGLYRDYRKRLLPEDAGDYPSWVSRFDTLGSAQMEALRARADRLGPDAPLISILVPTYCTPERWLRRCIESVINQVYPHWQLCIADDASPDARVMEILREYAATDRRIAVTRRDANGHIAEASNTALSMARGSYIGLLDHDDELRPHALLEMAEAIVADPGLALL
ncbi:MAG: glycosyltransferase, partial [Luteimonas sp.]|nr:glycosyltransferase [Luteimonas sp.]